jgi:hypothetical protein
MSYINPHSEYIDKRIADLQKHTEKWNTKIVETSHKDFIEDFFSNVFTNFILWTFTKAYLKKHPCSECKEPSEERCHGLGEERPILMKRALERVWPDTSKAICIREILIAFLEEHKTTKFTFKCKACHRAEPKAPRRSKAK